MNKETLSHATELQTTIRDVEMLLEMLEKSSIREVKVSWYDWKPRPEQEKRIRAAIIADQKAELECLKAELAAL